MGLADLLAKMEQRAVDTPDTPCNLCKVSAKPAPIKACTLDTPDTPQIINAVVNVGADLPEPANDLHLPERTSLKVTPEQEAELKALMAFVGVAHAFTHTEQQEGLALALNDPDAMAELGIVLDHDDRRHCDQCTNLKRDICTIAEPKADALVVANRDYRPVRETPRRCTGYAPGPDDLDRRLGLERWPRLIEKGASFEFRVGADVMGVSKRGSGVSASPAKRALEAGAEEMRSTGAECGRMTYSAWRPIRDHEQPTV